VVATPINLAHAGVRVVHRAADSASPGAWRLRRSAGSRQAAAQPQRARGRDVVGEGLLAAGGPVDGGAAAPIPATRARGRAAAGDRAWAAERGHCLPSRTLT